ncbi:DUF1330 domain-containing protein [Methylopila sp. Yamaguchi]|uniref:DUF1330 domain-containing protein n=1 Tax=Methylopila sp. Yamaguchi TaxID=1437817 RepID=UPI000CCAD499|nr:DUF1330 domain-containing protein [Methylopila sp. Yamaguchi]GBD50853.1 hypothetical protein METY_4066 [Methylopila sp. Yamaguchi]
MPKGYWIVRIHIKDQAGYDAYRNDNAEAFAKYDARFLVRGGKLEALEGEARARNVVIEFPSYEQAVACWRSPEYQRAKARRDGAVEIDLIAIEGYEG